MSSTTMRSLRQIRATVRATEPSALARPIAAVRDSRVNQATRRSGVDRGVGEGLDEVGSCRCRTGRRRRGSPPGRSIPGWPGRSGWRSGMEESSGRQEAKVLPAGKSGGLAAHAAGGGVAADDFLGDAGRAGPRRGPSVGRGRWRARRGRRCAGRAAASGAAARRARRAWRGSGTGHGEFLAVVVAPISGQGRARAGRCSGGRSSRS